MVNGPQQVAVALVTVRAMPATRKRKVRGFGPQKLGIHPASSCQRLKCNTSRMLGAQSVSNSMVALGTMGSRT